MLVLTIAIKEGNAHMKMFACVIHSTHMLRIAHKVSVLLRPYLLCAVPFNSLKLIFSFSKTKTESCPYGESWAGKSKSTGLNTTHGTSECSNLGLCNRATVRILFSLNCRQFKRIIHIYIYIYIYIARAHLRS